MCWYSLIKTNLRSTFFPFLYNISFFIFLLTFIPYGKIHPSMDILLQLLNLSLERSNLRGNTSCLSTTFSSWMNLLTISKPIVLVQTTSQLELYLHTQELLLWYHLMREQPKMKWTQQEKENFIIKYDILLHLVQKK